MQSRRDGCRASAPIVSSQRHLLQAESVGEINQVLSDGRLLSHARSRGIAESCGPVAPQVRHQHSMSSLRQRRRDMVECVSVIGKAVQQDDRKSLRIAALFVRDVENRGLNRIESLIAPEPSIVVVLTMRGR